MNLYKETAFGKSKGTLKPQITRLNQQQMTPSAAPYIDSQDENHLKRPSTQEWAGKRKRR